MVILGVDSSATSCSCSVCEDGKILSEMYTNNGYTHSVSLLPLIKSALEMSGKELKDVDYIAVCDGPGSFTGIRIGIATVKGLCFTDGIKVIPVSTLECIAYPLKSSQSTAVAVMDARCSQVYSSLFDCTEGFVRLTDDEAIRLDDLAEKLKEIDGRKILIGDGADVSYKHLKDNVADISIANEPIKYQNASSAALLSFEKTDRAIDAETLVPSYLRPPNAQTLKARGK